VAPLLAGKDGQGQAAAANGREGTENGLENAHCARAFRIRASVQFAHIFPGTINCGVKRSKGFRIFFFATAIPISELVISAG